MVKSALRTGWNLLSSAINVILDTVRSTLLDNVVYCAGYDLFTARASHTFMLTFLAKIFCRVE